MTMKDDFRRPILAAFGGVMLIAGAGMAGAFDRTDQGVTASASNAPAGVQAIGGAPAPAS